MDRTSRCRIAGLNTRAENPPPSQLSMLPYPPTLAAAQSQSAASCVAFNVPTTASRGTPAGPVLPPPPPPPQPTHRRIAKALPRTFVEADLPSIPMRLLRDVAVRNVQGHLQGQVTMLPSLSAQSLFLLRLSHFLKQSRRRCSAFSLRDLDFAGCAEALFTPGCAARAAVSRASGVPATSMAMTSWPTAFFSELSCGRMRRRLSISSLLVCRVQ